MGPRFSGSVDGGGFVRRWLGSPLPALAAALPLLLAGVTWLPLPVDDTFQGLPFWLVYSLSLTLIVLALILQGIRRSFSGFFLNAAVFTALLWIGWTLATTCSASVSLGMGASPSAFRVTECGFLGRPPHSLPVLTDVDNSRDQCTFQTESKFQTAGKNKTITYKGWSLSVISMHHAPLFSLKSPGGGEQSLLVKLDDPENPRDFFEYDVLPFRFYYHLSRSHEEEAPFFPESLSCSVVRGKHIIATGNLHPGSSMEFEGFQLSYGKGAPWVILHIRRKVFYWPGILILFFLLGFAACSWRERERV